VVRQATSPIMVLVILHSWLLLLVGYAFLVYPAICFPLTVPVPSNSCIRRWRQLPGGKKLTNSNLDLVLFSRAKQRERSLSILHHDNINMESIGTKMKSVDTETNRKAAEASESSTLEASIEFAKLCGKLKQTPRTGW
jgi:hypothetical protein